MTNTAPAANEKENAIEGQASLAERNLEFLSGITSEYMALFYMNIGAYVFKAYSADPERMAEIRKLMAKIQDPVELVREFARSISMHPEDRPVFHNISREDIEKRLRDNKRFSVRFRRLSGDDYRWCEMDVIKCDSLSDRMNALIIGFADRDKEIRQEIAAEEAREFSRIIESVIKEYSSVYVVNIKKDTYRVLKQNEDFEKKYDVGSFSESIRLYVEQEVHPVDVPRLLAALDYGTIAEKLKESHSYKVEFRNINGVIPLWYELYIASVGGGDEVIFALAEKDNELLLRHIEAVIADRFEGIYVANLNEDSMKILKGTGGFKKYEGKLVPIRATMKQFSANLPGEDRIFFRDVYGEPEMIKKVLIRDKDIEYFYRSPYYGGELVWMKSEIHTLTLDADGNPETAMVGISPVDSQQREKMEMNATIAEQKAKLEEQQERLKDALSLAQSANRAKTTFLNSMSHDIRTPMNAIMGYTGLAISHIDNTSLIREYLAKISRSSDHLLSLINDVLDMSRIESGKMEIEEKPENILEIVRTLTDIVQADVNKKRLTLILEDTGLKHTRVLCDRLRVNQVLLNIVSNAIKYTPEGGKILFSVTERPVNYDGYTACEFCVEDTGIGMEEEFLKTIFDPFTRVRSSTVSGIQGTGLGMAITKNIVDMMGGRIQIDSSPGAGTKVTIIFNFQLYTTEESAIIEKTAESTPENYDFSGKRLLLVEDNELNREIATEILEEEGFVIDTAEDGSIAVEKVKHAETGQYQLILMDVQMPLMDGYEATREIRALGGEISKIPIIAMTANAFEEDRKNAIAAGMDAHIAKPIDISKLKETLRKFTS